MARGAAGGGGRFWASVTLPAAGAAATQGTVFFAHGFAQGPESYAGMAGALADQGLALVAPHTSIFSWPVWRSLGRRARELRPDGPVSLRDFGAVLQYSLQAQLAEDLLTCVRVVRGGPGPSRPTCALREAVPAAARARSGLLGHSMGAGLLFWVARAAGVPCAACLAPLSDLRGPLRPGPVARSLRRRVDCLVLAAEEDGFAPPRACEGLARDVNGSPGGGRALFLSVPGGTHTGFEDCVSLGRLPLAALLGAPRAAAALPELAAALFRPQRLADQRAARDAALAAWLAPAVLARAPPARAALEAALRAAPALRPAFRARLRVLQPR